MGETWDEFDVIRPKHPNMVNSFRAVLAQLIARYVHPTDLADQQRYLEMEEAILTELSRT